VLSPVGVSVICLLGVFVVGFVGMCAIQPPFTKRKADADHPLEADKFSVGRAAAAAAISTLVAALIMAIVALVQWRGRKGKPQS
jgi:ABC-type Fe3+ transport system permease subunit